LREAVSADFMLFLVINLFLFKEAEERQKLNKRYKNYKP
jgi:hypothetical protein